MSTEEWTVKELGLDGVGPGLGDHRNFRNILEGLTGVLHVCDAQKPGTAWSNGSQGTFSLEG